MWWLTSQKNGASALGLQCWAWAATKRPGLGCISSGAPWCPGRDRLSGRVEVDETYLGGLEEGVRGRQTDAKALSSSGRGRWCRHRAGSDTHHSQRLRGQLMAFVGESIEPGSVVHTDGWLGYEPPKATAIATR